MAEEGPILEELKAQAQSLASIRRTRSIQRAAAPSEAAPNSEPGLGLGSPSQELSRSVVPIPTEEDLEALSPRFSSSQRASPPGGRSDSQSRVGAFESLLKPGGPELSVDERRTLETACRVHQLSSQQLQGEVEELHECCSELRERLREEAEKAVLAEERHQAEREALETALRNTHAQGQKEQVQAVHALKTSGAEKDQILQALIAWAAEIQQMALDLQEALQEQLSGFRALTAAVRGLMKDLRPLDALQNQQNRLQDVQIHLAKVGTAVQKERSEKKRMVGLHHAEMNGMKEMVQRWKLETEARHQQAERLHQEVSHHRQREQNRAERAAAQRVRDQIDLVKEVGHVLQGVEASFVESDGQLHKCKLRVEFDAWPGWLVWVDQRSEWMGSCQLASINLLAYGYASKACTLSKEAAPENSFSVHTTRSTFNFVFAGDAEFFSLLPVLSRLCAHVQGWPVAGSVSSRAELVRWHGWCKVQQSLRLRKAGR